MSLATEVSKTFVGARTGVFQNAALKALEVGTLAVDTVEVDEATFTGPTTFEDTVTITAGESLVVQSTIRSNPANPDAILIAPAGDQPLIARVDASYATLGGDPGATLSSFFVANNPGQLCGIVAPSSVTIGDLNNVTSGAGLAIDCTNDVISTFSATTDINTTSLEFTGAALEANASGVASGKFLNITLNGVAYKIPLNNV